VTPVRPDVNALVDLAVEGAEYLSRVEGVVGDSIAVAAPLNGTLEPPEPGEPIAVRWSAGTRGRWVVPTSLLSIRRPKGKGLAFWNLRLEREPELHQRRQFARGGGGAPVLLENSWSGALSGDLSDISEGGLRCRFPYANLRPGETVTVNVPLGGDRLRVNGWVLRVTEDNASRSTDVVVTFDLPEHDAGMVRRYVIQQQILARKAAADALP
jgi:hypothetical protein